MTAWTVPVVIIGAGGAGLTASMPAYSEVST